MKNIFFDSWDSIIRTVVITILAYIILIFFLRASGKRTLSKMNAFDLIVTIALGSTLATVMLSKEVALIDGVVAFFLLIFLQYIITYFSVRNKSLSKLVKSTPALLMYKGKIFKEIMKKERVTENELYAILREKGLGSMDEACAIVLETDGSLTIIKSYAAINDKILSNTIQPEELL